jgi:hypothetical protein
MKSLRRLFLQFTLIVTVVVSGFAIASASIATYFFVAGGVDRVREEFSRESQFGWRADGEGPAWSIMYPFFFAPMLIGFYLGILAWRVGARRLGKLDALEIAAVIGGSRPPPSN